MAGSRPRKGTAFFYLACMKIFLVIVTAIVFFACGKKESRATAYITQRRLDTSGRLVLTYRFMAKDTWVWDSMRVDNRIIPNDSLVVLFSSENPVKSRLELPR
jgi:hypothetical protein